jgi:carbonic anhydrase
MTSRRAPIASSLSILGLALSGVAGCGASPSGPQHAGPPWSYSENGGPAAWGDIDPAYALCKSGSEQSPIDVPLVVAKAKLAPLALHYEPFPMRIRNDGHTVRVEGTKEATLTIGDGPADRYELQQLHFHSPSEHTIGGQAFELEMHLVHKNAQGQLAVLGVLFKKGRESAALGAILDHAPEQVSTTSADVGGVRVDPAALVPDTSSYVRYTGSLTAPPCTEGVEWLLVSAVKEASPAQIAKLRGILKVATNRPVQPLAGRQILQREK